MEIENRISFQIEGLEKDGGDLRFNIFIQQLDLIKKALSETQKLLSATQKTFIKVVDLEHNSPAQIVVEITSEKAGDEIVGRQVANKFINSFEEIEKGKYPENFTYDTFVAYKNIVSLKEKNKLREIKIFRNGNVPLNLDDTSKKIEKIMGKDQYELGSYTGFLDWINIHNQNILYIYPTSNLPKLKCTFSKKIKDDVIRSIGRYVTVYGEKVFKPAVPGFAPYEMKITNIKIHREKEDLPKLSDFIGIAPNITGNKSSEDYIRDIRDEW